jgi:hypothetical protein
MAFAESLCPPVVRAFRLGDPVCVYIYVCVHVRTFLMIYPLLKPATQVPSGPEWADHEHDPVALRTAYVFVVTGTLFALGLK